MSRCTVTNIQGKQCRLVEHSADIGLCHNYEPLPTYEDTIVSLTAERDAARAAMDDLQSALAKGDSAAGFFLAAWQSANRTIAELRVELAKERERTAELVGAGEERWDR